MNGNRIIVHTLIKAKDKYLVIKRAEEETTYPGYFDIPGGLVNYKEFPRDAAIRETKEEVNLNIIPTKIIHEDSNYDEEKDTIFIRLVYLCELSNNFEDIKLDLKEHSEYRLINNLDELNGELIVPFLEEVFLKDL